MGDSEPAREQRDGLIDYDQAAHELRVPVPTLRKWVSRDLVPHYRIGPRVVRFDLAELRAWLETRRRGDK